MLLQAVSQASRSGSEMPSHHVVNKKPGLADETGLHLHHRETNLCGRVSDREGECAAYKFQEESCLSSRNGRAWHAWVEEGEI